MRNHPTTDMTAARMICRRRREMLSRAPSVAGGPPRAEFVPQLLPHTDHPEPVEWNTVRPGVPGEPVDGEHVRRRDQSCVAEPPRDGSFVTLVGRHGEHAVQQLQGEQACFSANVSSLSIRFGVSRRPGSAR